MKTDKIKIDDRTSSLLAAIAEARDDPRLIAELAQVDPDEFRKFISEYVEVDDEEAIKLLKAAESLPPDSITQKNVRRYRRGSDSLFKSLTVPGTIVPRISPFRLVLLLYLGIGVSFAYGLLGFALLFYLGGQSEALSFFAAYTVSFKTIFSLSLILGTALIAFHTQNVIPQTIEAAFKGQLSAGYYFHKRRFESLRLSITFSAEFVIVGFVIFSYCQFPLSRSGEALMVVAVCIEYALGAYVLRKLMHAGMMLHSLMTATGTRNLFRKRELDSIAPYVHVVSTLTVICVCVHTIVYYRGPFLYGSILGRNINTFLLLPALIAIPLLLPLHFYPRAVLRKLYSQSIDVETRRLKKALRHTEFSAYEKRCYLIEFQKMSRSELRSNLGLTLSDLLIGLTILITILGAILRLW
jgi:hypothetical protein